MIKKLLLIYESEISNTYKADFIFRGNYLIRKLRFNYVTSVFVCFKNFNNHLIASKLLGF